MNKLSIKLKILSLLTIILVFSCSPATSNLNGDIFLTMKNGSVKPVAASEVYLFPIETDFDSSFVMPLKAFINSAKYNIAKMEVEEACNERLDSCTKRNESLIVNISGDH